MSFRIGSALHERLIAAATTNERSLSEEIERRLEKTFEVADAREVYAVQAIHSTLEELEQDLGHPYSIAVAIYMGQGFTNIANEIRAKNKNEIWFDNPERMKEAADFLHRRVDTFFKKWPMITYQYTFWGLFQKYKDAILKKAEDGFYDRKAAESEAAHGEAARNKTDTERHMSSEHTSISTKKHRKLL